MKYTREKKKKKLIPQREERERDKVYKPKFGLTRRHCEAYKHNVLIHIAFFLEDDGQRPRGCTTIDEPRTGVQRPKSRNFTTSLAKLFFGGNDAKACRNAWQFSFFFSFFFSLISHDVLHRARANDLICR